MVREVQWCVCLESGGGVVCVESGGGVVCVESGGGVCEKWWWGEWGVVCEKLW